MEHNDSPTGTTNQVVAAVNDLSINPQRVEVVLSAESFTILKKEKILTDQEKVQLFPLLVQVFGTKPTVTQPNCFYVTISNGSQYYQCKLDSRLSHLVTAGKLTQGAILAIDHFLCHTKPVFRDGSPKSELVVITHASVKFDGQAIALIGPPELWKSYLDHSNSVSNGGGIKRRLGEETDEHIDKESDASSKRVKNETTAAESKESSGTVSSTTATAAKKKVIQSVLFTQLRKNTGNGWQSYARVVMKSILFKTKTNKEFFYIYVMDAEKNEVKITFYHDVPKQHYSIREGQLYRMEALKIDDLDAYSKPSVQLLPTGNKRSDETVKVQLVYNGSWCKFEAIADANNALGIPQHGGKFVPISEIKDGYPRLIASATGNALSNGRTNEPAVCVDVVGVVISVSEVVETQKDDRISYRRVVRIVDKSMVAIDVTLWNATAQEYTEAAIPPGKTTLAFVKAGLTSFNGLSLKTDLHTKIYKNPPFVEGTSTLEWYENVGIELGNFDCVTNGSFNGSDYNASNTSARTEDGNLSVLTLSDVHERGLGSILDQEDRCFVLARVKTFHCTTDRLPWYFACPQCRIRAVQQKPEPVNGRAEYYCAKCDRNTCTPILRYRTSATLWDGNDSIKYVQLWHDDVLKVLNNIKPEDFKTILDTQGEAAFLDLLENSYKKQWKFLLSAKGKEKKPFEMQQSGSNHNNDEENNNEENGDSPMQPAENAKLEEPILQVRPEFVIKRTIEASYDEQSHLLEQQLRQKQDWLGGSANENSSSSITNDPIAQGCAC